MMYIPSFIKIGSGIQKLLREDTQTHRLHGDFISLLLFFFRNNESSLCWLRHYATSRKAAGSIPNDVIEFFNLPNPSSRTVVLGSTQPLIEISTRNLPGGYRAGGA
jgi:hypothetical protein